MRRWHTVPVTDSGFSEDARGRSSRAPAATRQTPAQGPRRPSAAFSFFAVVVVGLVGFAAWAWAGRVHTDDLVAYDTLGATITEMDRSLTPLGHSEIPPCRDSAEGVITRTYPPSTGPQAAVVLGYLLEKGWTEGTATAPVLAHLTKVEGDHELTIDIIAPSPNQLVESLTGHSAVSSLACLLR